MASKTPDSEHRSLSKLRHSIEERLDSLRQSGVSDEVLSVLDDLALYKDTLEEREQSVKGVLVDLVDDMSQASQTLTETGTRLEAMLEAAEDVAFVIASRDDGTILEFSAGAEQIFGYTRQEALGLHASILCPVEEALPDDEPYACSLISHPRGRVLLKRKNNQVFPALYSAYPLKNNHDEITASLIIALDIAKQEMAEKLLRESHTRYRELALASPISIITFDAWGVVTFMNEWHMKMMGRGDVDATSFIGRKVHDLPCLRRSGTSDKIQPVFEGKPVSLEDAYLPPFGNRAGSWHNIRISPLTQDDEFLGGILILEDITRRKQTELNLKLLIDSSPIPLLRVTQSEQGKLIRYLNPVARDMFGAEALNKPVEEFITPMDEEVAELSAMDGERCEVLTVDGPRQAIRASHRSSDDSEVLAVLDVGVLLEAKEAAEDASRAKSDFLANISHEIRTPLNALLGMLQLLGEADLGEEINELTGYAMGSAQSLLTLLNDLLDFSVIEAHALALDENDFDLGKLVELVATPYRIEASNRSLQFNCAVDPELPAKLFGDARRLRQIIFHVLGNAVKFTDTGSVTMSVEQGDAASSDHIPVILTISDTGIGMSKEEMEHIFEPFRQADGSRTRRHGGTGIGLALVHEFLAAMNGTIEVDSEAGVGTRFVITIGFTKSKPAPSVA